MYIHVCVCVYMCVYVYTCVCMYTDVYVYNVRVYVYVCTVCIQVCVYTWRSTYQYTHIGVELVHGLAQQQRAYWVYTSTPVYSA